MRTVPEFTLRKTPGGTRFGLRDGQGPKPAPTLFVFQSTIEKSLTDDIYFHIGRLLGHHGYLSVSLDLPCHGADRRTEERDGLNGWRDRLDRGEDLVSGFCRQASEVLDFLIRERSADPERIVVAGTSRGGFMGFHFAASEPRVKRVAAFAPVTGLSVLSEFQGLENHALTRSLAARHLCAKLAGRPVWICIGNNDQRVGTDLCIAFARQLVVASLAQGKPAPVEIRVLPSEGHSTDTTAHKAAAAWMVGDTKG